MSGFRFRTVAAAIAGVLPLLASAADAVPAITTAKPLAQLSGVVTSPTGSAVADAQIILKQSGGGEVAQGFTSAQGHFTLQGIPSGSYTLVSTGPDGAQATQTVQIGSTPLNLGTITLQAVQTLSTVQVVTKRRIPEVRFITSTARILSLYRWATVRRSIKSCYVRRASCRIRSASCTCAVTMPISNIGLTG